MRTLLLLLGLSLWVSSAELRTVHECSPVTWCSSPETALHCGVLEHCLKSNQTKWSTAEPARIKVYYESLCPDCIDFFNDMLYPSFKLLGDIMDLTIVPYGKAQEWFDGEKYVFTCQHGPKECLGNMIQACLLNLTKTEAKTIIFCMEEAKDVLKATELCVELHTELSKDTLWSCVYGDLGNQLMHQNALMTEALRPTSVPWVTVNGVHTDELQRKAMSALTRLVCGLYKGTKPDICSCPEDDASKLP